MKWRSVWKNHEKSYLGRVVVVQQQVTKAPECASALANLPSQMSISGVHDSSDCQHIHENSYRFYDSLLKFTSYKNLKPFVMVFEET